MLKLIIDALMSGFRARRALALENLALRQQILVLQRTPTRNRPSTRSTDCSGSC
jgi:hypothetical protein